MAARILVIDDDPGIRSVLERGLRQAGFEVESAADGEVGLAVLRQLAPHLVVLDILLPGLDGFEVCRRIRETEGSRDLPVLMLTARDEVSDRVAGLNIGADDYLVKPFALEELLARVRALLRRKPGATIETLLSFSDLRLNTETREVSRSSRTLTLTPKEYDLLTAFLKHPRQVLTRELLLEEVWGFDFEGDSNVLDVYVGYLRQKLEAAGEPRLIQTVRGVGYVLKE